MSDYTVLLSQIKHTFGEREVLKGIDISIKPGEIFGLLGPSGAGKTTIIRIITGQIKPSGGLSQLFETDSSQLDGKLLQKTGMMLDNLGLYERLSCADNLKLFAAILGADKSMIDIALEKVGLSAAKKQPVSKLSKGMKSRLALARAILNKPSILFLDEPTSGLDPSTAAEIHRLILEERDRGATIFLTTHNMAEASSLCDNIALLNEGTIIEYGSPAQICRKYDHERKISVTLNDGSELEFSNNSSSADKIYDLLKNDSIKSIHSSEPNLETVFTSLTGRRLEQ